MNDVYAAPKSDLNHHELGDFSVFDRFSAWYVLGLSIITLSLYIPYWLYTRTAKLNAITEDKISNAFSNTVVIYYILSLAVGFGVEFIEVSNNVYLAVSIADFVSNILILVWVFKFRNRLFTLSWRGPIRLGAVMTFFFQIIYLQFKINEIIDHTSTNDEGRKTL